MQELEFHKGLVGYIEYLVSTDSEVWLMKSSGVLKYIGLPIKCLIIIFSKQAILNYQCYWYFSSNICFLWQSPTTVGYIKETLNYLDYCSMDHNYKAWAYLWSIKLAVMIVSTEYYLGFKMDDLYI